MSYLAEEQIWYDGPDAPSTTFFGFFLAHDGWDMPIIPFTNAEDRDYAVDTALTWGLSYKDAVRVAALLSAYGEAENRSYLEAAFDIAGSGDHFDGVEFDNLEAYVGNAIWE